MMRFIFVVEFITINGIVSLQTNHETHHTFSNYFFGLDAPPYSIRSD